ncbi:MAG: stage V sporulation protein AD [Erysipelotrichales bacterium]|nr:stage V sporulation protein AD [Erysipelotrichales bacterium]
MRTYKLDSTYVLNYATAATINEDKGELRGKLDTVFDDIYCDEKNYELAEQKLMKTSIENVLKKSNLRLNDLELIVSGDLMNQLMTTYYGLRHISIPVIGIYSACSSSALGLIIGSNYAVNGKKVLVTTSSHYAAAERQFRYPNEYGLQKKEVVTTTTSGAGSIILTSKKHPIQIEAYTLGVIQDFNYKDVNDMGGAMSIAAYDTITTHFKDTNRSFKDYDYVVTGDLGSLGLSVLKALFKENGYTDSLDNLVDLGTMIYKGCPECYMGGSGCACSMLMLCGKYLPMIENGKINSLLYVPTGALHNPIAVFQKQSIPSIAHAIVFRKAV